MSQRPSDIVPEFERIRERMEQAYQRVIGGPGRPGFTGPILEPAVDVYQTETDVIVLIEMAGIAREQVELEVDGATFTFRGERKPLGGRPGRIYSQMEICQGKFERELTLPAEVNADGAQATYKDGILEIALPKAAPVTARNLKIVVR